MTPENPDAAKALHAYITQLHQTAGAPSTRTLAEAIGTSHTYTAGILAGETTRSRWHNLEALTRHLNGDVDHVRALWKASRTPPPPPQKPTHQLLTEILDELRAIRTALQHHP